jgi:hypothetical protein
MMFTRIFKLTALAATAATALAQSTDSTISMSRQLAGDFAWDLMAEDGYPIITFNDGNEESEVVFKFNFTGTLGPTKFLDVNLYQSDCVGPADGLALAFVNNTVGDELNVDLDIIQETISDSIHYTDFNRTTATIGFCLRVDYNYIDTAGDTESVNFYETNVTINVDLTAGFELTAIQVDRTAASQEAANAELDYPVEAYICLDDNSEVATPLPLTQGSALQVCIKIDDDVVTENVYVEDILTFNLSQPQGQATPSSPIVNAVANPLTDKVCREGGICNVKTQLQSKFFTDQEPTDLRIDGMAILAFGKASLMPSAAPTGPTRRLRAPIRGLLSGEDIKAFMAAQQEKNGGDETALVVSSDSSGRMLQAGGAA